VDQIDEKVQVDMASLQQVIFGCTDHDLSRLVYVVVRCVVGSQLEVTGWRWAADDSGQSGCTGEDHFEACTSV